MTKTIYAAIFLISAFLSDGRAQQTVAVKNLPDLPVPISNNATALWHTDQGPALFSFKGLGQGKGWQDIVRTGFALSPGDNSWRKIAPVPGRTGELAATATGLGNRIFIFGGYSVAPDHSEATVGRSYEYDPKTDKYTPLPEIPVPVDDSVSFTIGDRYIFLISGWHNSGNVNLSQVYDTRDKRWFQASPYPGRGLFGHAGAAVGNRFIICDGVEKNFPITGRYNYQITDSCFMGEVNPAKPRLITWQRLKPHPGKPRYRMAAGGYRGRGDWIVFAGGSDNPYNYNGIGYDKKPSSPSDGIMAYSLDDSRWYPVGRLDFASMDHRRLLVSGNRFFIAGGMGAGQKVTGKTVEFCLSDSTGKLLPCRTK